MPQNSPPRNHNARQVDSARAGQAQLNVRLRSVPALEVNRAARARAGQNQQRLAAALKASRAALAARNSLAARAARARRRSDERRQRIRRENSRARRRYNERFQQMQREPKYVQQAAAIPFVVVSIKRLQKKHINDINENLNGNEVHCGYVLNT